MINLTKFKFFKVILESLTVNFLKKSKNYINFAF